MSYNTDRKHNVSVSFGLPEVFIIGSVALLVHGMSVIGYAFLACGLLGAIMRLGQEVRKLEEEKKAQQEKWDSVRDMVKNATTAIKQPVKKPTGSSTDYH
jgi:hypothetical protein